MNAALRSAPLPFFTIGHSTRSVDELIDLLQGAQVRHLVDVRSMPRSRSNPQFNQDSLPDALAKAQISYRHIAALGGLRGKSHEVPAEMNGNWRNQSFHNYADYTLSEEFRAGLDELQTLGHDARTAFMCAEALWWRCHRRLIADQLLTRGEQVFHIMAEGQHDPAHLTPGAVIAPDGCLHYPSPQGQLL